MLAQVKLLDAAIRMDDFTTAELARESQVSQQEVRKFLRENNQIFSVIIKNEEIQKRDRCILHTIDKIAAREMLDSCVAKIDLPNFMSDQDTSRLGLTLAQSTLLEMLPKCDSKEKWDLVRIAEMQLSMINDLSLQVLTNELQSLHQNLKIVVYVQTELMHASPHAAAEPSYTAILEVADTLTSSNERRARDVDKIYQRSRLQLVLELPKICASFATGSKTGHLNPGLWDLWWIDFPRAALDLLSHKLWQSTVGDLTTLKLLSDQSLTSRWISGTHSEYELRRRKAIADRSAEQSLNAYTKEIAKREALYSRRGIFNKSMWNKWPRYLPEISKSFRFASSRTAVPYSSLSNEQFQKFRHASHKRITFDDSPVTAYFEEKINNDLAVSQLESRARSPIGLLEAADLDLVEQILEGFLLKSDEEGLENSYAFFADIELRDDLILLKNKGALVPDTREFASDVDSVQSSDKSGVFKVKHPAIYQIRLDPGHAIDVIQVVYEFNDDHTMHHKYEKVGQVWWIDIDGDTGKFRLGYILYDETKSFSPMPFSVLNYDVERQCFFFEAGSGERLSNETIIEGVRRPNDVGTQH